MKKLIILLIFLLIIPCTLARQSEVINANNLRLDLISYSPSPVIIGSEVTLKFELFNIGTGVVRNFQIITVDKFPFELLSKKNIDILELRSGESYKFEVKLKVMSKVQEDTYQIGLQYYDPFNNRGESIAFDIPIKRIRRTIASTKVTTEPEYIAPGSIALINVEIENNADYSMRDVEVKLNFSGSVPLVPYQTTSQKQIENIPSKSSEIVTFQVIALPDAEPNVYMLPLHLTFDDELGNENTRQDYIGLIISKIPEYDLTVEDSSIIKGIKSSITVSLSNIGPSNIKYLIMEVLPSKAYEILNPPRTYIGNLEPDDYETAEFDFYPKKSGFIPVNVRLEYKDDLNNPIIDIKETKVYVYSQTKAKMMGLLPSTTFKNIFLILIIMFIYFTYKAWRVSRNLTLSMKQSLIKILTIFVKILRNLRWNYIKRIPRKIRIFFVKLK